MDVEGKLLAAMVECGLSHTDARVHAADFAALIRPKIARQSRDERIRKSPADTWAIAESTGLTPRRIQQIRNSEIKETKVSLPPEKIDREGKQ